jgi:hypothetical protein
MTNYLQSSRPQMEDTYWQVRQSLSGQGQQMLGL